MLSPGARRPDRQTRRPSILGICEEGATPRGGMPRPGVGVEITFPGDYEPARPPDHFKSGDLVSRSFSWARIWPPARDGSVGLRDALLRIFAMVMRSSTPPFGGSSR